MQDLLPFYEDGFSAETVIFPFGFQVQNVQLGHQSDVHNSYDGEETNHLIYFGLDHEEMLLNQVLWFPKSTDLDQQLAQTALICHHM